MRANEAWPQTRSTASSLNTGSTLILVLVTVAMLLSFSLLFSQATLDTHTEGAFHAQSLQEFTVLEGSLQLYRSELLGRYRMLAPSRDVPALGSFSVYPDGHACGELTTSTGDVLALAGGATGRKLMLSGFDGTHAFVLRAEPDEKGTLRGHLWSTDEGIGTWYAVDE